jgi:hypothetical protein
MKKKQHKQKIAYCIMCVMAILRCQQSHAQLSFGIEGGYNKNYLYTNTSNRDFTDYKPAGGFSIGLPVKYTIADWFAVQASPTFIKKNYSQQRSSFFDGIYQTNTNTYIQLPLMGHFMFGGEQFKGFLNLGMYGGYWAGARVKGSIPNILNPVDTITASNNFSDIVKSYSYNEKYAFDTRKDNRFEFGWLAGIGVSYKLNDMYEVYAEGRYYQSITDQQKKYMTNQIPRYNQTYGLSVGVMISLGSSEQ